MENKWESTITVASSIANNAPIPGNTMHFQQYGTSVTTSSKSVDLLSTNIGIIFSWNNRIIWQEIAYPQFRLRVHQEWEDGIWTLYSYRRDLEPDDFIYGPRESLIKFVEENYPLPPKPDSLLVDDLKLDSLVVGSRGLGMLKRFYS
ncbi:hypothetical protein IFM89_037746 [Coptis chinensis]|uniref:Uncharacterized protein n=1 Tax=Coptis chinensis TaxID=261450 RepID=A0A835IQB2_9MAGN|nr:hypothetical protein IFM89_037746 [Coptis chinensis]